MKNTDQPSHFSAKHERINSAKELIRSVVDSRKHEPEKRLIKSIAAELNVSFLDCAAALAYLMKSNPIPDHGQTYLPVVDNTEQAMPPKIRLVRYRLAVGILQNITVPEIKKILVEESGVDINNIANVRIQDTYTLIDLPDEMPQEIFHHLKTVEINQHQLDIRRSKNRGRMRNNRKYRQMKKSSQTQGFNNDVG